MLERPSELRFRSTSLQVLAGIQQNFIEPSIPGGDAHIITLFGSDTLTQSYGS
jgi:hypothetical protein